MAFTYRPTPEAEREIEEIKRTRLISTNSKAVDYAMKNILSTERELLESEDKNGDLEATLSVIKIAMRRKVEAGKIYDELVSELLSPE